MGFVSVRAVKLKCLKFLLRYTSGVALCQGPDLVGLSVQQFLSVTDLRKREFRSLIASYYSLIIPTGNLQGNHCSSAVFCRNGS